MRSKRLQKIIFAASAMLILAALAFLNSCKDHREFFTKEYRIAPDNFSVEGDSMKWTDPVDFASSALTIEAAFSHQVSYTLKITGLESGAKKELSGLSQNLFESWRGDHDGLYFFKAGEKAVVELTFLGSNKVVRDTITIAGAKKFASQGLALASTSIQEGFEGTTFSFGNATWSYGIYGDGDPVNDALNDIDMSAFGYGSTTRRDTMNPAAGVRPVQGKYALTLTGKDERGPYFVGGIKRVLSAAEQAQLADKSANELYVNLYIYGRGDANAKLNYAFYEFETGGPTADAEYEKQFTLDHTGWKLFSLKYSDLTVIKAGNGIMEPSKLKEIAFNLISAPPGNSVKATFDYPILTFGAPFDPKK